MGHLLDSHVLVWAASEPERLGAAAHRVLRDPSAELHVSSVTIAELEIKIALGKLSLPASPTTMSQRLFAQPLALTWDHASRLRDLPTIHSDPFDRLLIVQAEAEDLALVTADRNIARYPKVRVLWE